MPSAPKTTLKGKPPLKLPSDLLKPTPVNPAKATGNRTGVLPKNTFTGPGWSTANPNTCQPFFEFS